MNFIALVAGAVAFASCLVGLALLWRAKAYAVLTYLFALPVLHLAVLGFLPNGPRIIASAMGALLIAAPVAFMQRKAKATKTAL
ncbi:hypothetical protein [Sphingopyxis sp.]|uniref:hypothetical protein n=1 Tax=Sphingopyxis sp. TaxID=1908224 RepID=UPI003D0C765C